MVLRNILDFKMQSFKKVSKNKKFLTIGYIGSYLKYKGLGNLIIAVQNLVDKGIELLLPLVQLSKEILYLKKYLKV